MNSGPLASRIVFGQPRPSANSFERLDDMPPRNRRRTSIAGDGQVKVSTTVTTRILRVRYGY
jgi:hypothetical protein